MDGIYLYFIYGRRKRDLQDLDGAVPREDALGVEAVEDGEVHLRVGPGADWNWWWVGVGCGESLTRACCKPINPCPIDKDTMSKVRTWRG